MPTQCRACLLETNNVSEFLPLNISLKLSSNKIISIKECFYQIMNLNYEPGCNLPDRVCLKCVTFLKKMFNFIEQCRKSEEILQNNVVAQTEFRAPELALKKNISTIKHSVLPIKSEIILQKSKNQNIPQQINKIINDTQVKHALKPEKRIHKDLDFPLNFKKSKGTTSDVQNEITSELSMLSSIDLVRGTTNPIESCEILENTEILPISISGLDSEMGRITSPTDSNTKNTQSSTIDSKIMESSEISIIETSENQNSDSFNPVSTHWPDFEDDLDQQDTDYSDNSKIMSDAYNSDFKNITSRLSCSVHGQSFWTDLLNGTLDTSDFFEKKPSTFCTCFVDFHGNDTSDVNCPFCDDKFRTYQAFVNHRIKIHKNKIKEWNAIKSLKNKMDTLICHVCGVVVHRSLIRSHLTKCAETFQCSFCSYKFLSHANLECHEETKHAADEEMVMYECQECQQLFTSPNSLKSHLMGHYKSNFKCSLCDKTFHVKGHLNAHLKIHELERKNQVEVINGFNNINVKTYESKFRKNLKGETKSIHVIEEKSNLKT